MKKKIVLGMILILLAVIVFRTFRFKSRQIHIEPVRDITVNADESASLLAGALQYATVSNQDPSQWNPEPFVGFQNYLREKFPAVHEMLNPEIIGTHSLLFTWKGSDSSKLPVLLMAHMDVVPAVGNWKYPPFGGQIAEGYIWGRGALDDKSDLIMLLYAVEISLKAGVKPNRTIYLAFGHDEEVSGLNGASAIAAHLRNQKVQLEFLMDEGMAIAENMIPTVKEPVALIGIAEKGYLTLELTAEGSGGHSSAPPEQTTIGLLSEAIQALERHQMPARLDGTSREMFRYLGPEMSLPLRAVFANFWLTAPLVKYQLLGTPSTAPMVRTTTAVTMVQAGIKENVLARTATATVNFRILPGDRVEDVMKHVHDIADPMKIKVTNPHNLASEPSEVSSTGTGSFQTLHRSIQQVFPDVLVAPALLMGATDSRHYSQLTKNVYRFSPFRFTEQDLSRVHGEDERIAVKDCAEMARFYIQLIRNCCT